MKMVKIIDLLFKPSRFFHLIKNDAALGIVKVLLWGYGFGALSQFVWFLLDQWLLQKNILIEIIDSGIVMADNYSIIKTQILLRVFVIHVIIIPVITILLRIVAGFILTWLLGIKKANLSGVSKIVCFSMIANFLFIIPTIGVYIGSCYLFYLLFLGCKTVFESKLWQAFVFALPLVCISFQSLLYTSF